MHERLSQFSGDWVAVGTGWSAWLESGKDSGLTFSDGDMPLPTAGNMLPVATQMLAAGEIVAVEHAEPVYLCSTVARKKLPGKE